MRCSTQPKDRISVKGYGFISFQKNMVKSLRSNYGQKLLDSTKNSATSAFKTASKRAIQKEAETNGDLIGNKSAEKITCENPNKLPAEIGKSLIQPKGISKKKKKRKKKKKNHQKNSNKLLMNFDYYNHRYT